MSESHLSHAVVVTPWTEEAIHSESKGQFRRGDCASPEEVTSVMAAREVFAEGAKGGKRVGNCHRTALFVRFAFCFRFEATLAFIGTEAGGLNNSKPAWQGEPRLIIGGVFGDHLLSRWADFVETTLRE